MKVFYEYVEIHPMCVDEYCDEEKTKFGHCMYSARGIHEGGTLAEAINHAQTLGYEFVSVVQEGGGVHTSMKYPDGCTGTKVPFTSGNSITAYALCRKKLLGAVV